MPRPGKRFFHYLFHFYFFLFRETIPARERKPFDFAFFNYRSTVVPWTRHVRPRYNSLASVFSWAGYTYLPVRSVARVERVWFKERETQEGSIARSDYTSLRRLGIPRSLAILAVHSPETLRIQPSCIYASRQSRTVIYIEAEIDIAPLKRDTNPLAGRYRVYLYIIMR